MLHMADCGLDEDAERPGNLDDLLDEADIVFERLLAGIQHDAGAAGANGIDRVGERVAMVEAESDRHRSLGCKLFCDARQRVEAGDLARVRMDADNDRGILLFGGGDRRLDDFDVHRDECTDRVFVVGGMLQEAVERGNRHDDVLGG